VFDRRPSLLGNCNISMDTPITPVFLHCMVTNSWKASVSIVAGSVKEGKTIPEVLVSASRPMKLVFVSLRKQKSPVLAVNYRRRKPVFRRVSVVSGLRSLSLYLVELLC
jgi:hypothetical protein